MDLNRRAFLYASEVVQPTETKYSAPALRSYLDTSSTSSSFVTLKAIIHGAVGALIGIVHHEFTDRTGIMLLPQHNCATAIQFRRYWLMHQSEGT